MSYFILGNHTGIGKTVVSLVLAKKLNFSYWKPIQSGYPTDTDFIKHFGVNTVPSKYVFNNPVSPHYAAELENTKIEINSIKPPEENLIIESAGGILSPLNDKETNFDLGINLKIPVILVIGNYLGSINHSLLTIEKIQNSSMEFKGVIISGENSIHSEDYISKYAKIIGRVPVLDFKNLDLSKTEINL